MASRKSKRIPRGKQMKAARKVRENFRKKQRHDRKVKDEKIKVPRALLLTEAEKERIQFIREQTEQRTAEHREAQGQTEAAPGYIMELSKALETADTVVEVVDYRDIVQSRARSCEELVKKHSKCLYIYLSHYSEHFRVDCRALERDGLTIIQNLSVFDNSKNICIFGNAKSGKFTLFRLIEGRGIHAAFTRITTPVERILPSAVMRGAVDEKHVDLLASFREIYPYMNPQSLVDFYKLRPCGRMEELFLMLGKAHSSEIRERRTMCAGALHVLKDIRAGKIQWICVNEQYAFKFN